MGKAYTPPIRQAQQDFVAKQNLFFVATAPLSSTGRVNVSPKSAAEFRIVDEQRVGYVDLTGSGSETAAHIYDNGRLVIMFVALSGAPMIVRFHGRGRVLLSRDLFGAGAEPGLAAKLGVPSPAAWDEIPGARCAILMDVTRVSHSCGYSIPKYEYVKERTTLTEYTLHSPDIKGYSSRKNSFSIDGLRSVAQSNCEDTPVRRTLEDGYYMAEFDKKNRGALATLRRIVIRMQMLAAARVHGKLRDAVMVAMGFMVAVLLQRARRTIAQ